MSDEQVQPVNPGSAAEEMHTIGLMEEPKSAVGVFELPCGYLDPVSGELLTEVQVREMTGVEEDMLASGKVPNAQKMSLLLSGCVVRIGTITNSQKIASMVRDLTVGDRVFLLFAIRRVTLGDELPVREKCPECDLRSLFMIDLSQDLEIKKMADPSQRVFDVELPSGKKARFRVSTGADEERLSKLRRGTDALSQSILMRLELLGDEKPTLPMVKSLGMRDRNYLRTRFEEVEGGVNTSLELECPSCGCEWKKNMELSAASFFFPGDQQER